MGIDLHNLGLLGHTQDRGAGFKRTIGIGRQALASVDCERVVVADLLRRGASR